MNKDVFFKNFELLADAPNGIKKLRELILQLAIRGKLVSQDKSDESASILIKKIQEEKNRSVNGTVAQRKSQSKVGITNVPYDLPINWKWVRFGDIVICRDGERIPVARSERENRDKIYDYYGASGIIDKIDNYLFDKPLLLIGEDGANLLNRSTPIAFIAEGKYWVNNHAHVIDGVSLDFLRYLEVFINAIDLSPYVTGSAQPKMNQAKMNSIPIAIPPLAEQKRIVSKVNELMSLCDKLESRRQKKQEVQSKLNSAALERMLSAENQEEFEQYWQRICENFDLLYDNPENVEKLKQAILQLAVQGKLVPQNPEDEPASFLIEKIKAEKKRYAKEYNLKEKELLPPVKADEAIFKLPAGWTWSRIGNSFLTSSGTTPKRSNHDYFIDGTENWVKTTDLTNGIVTSCEERITPEAVKDCNLKYYPIGTVCVAMYGGAGTIGKSGILGMESTINQSVCGIYPNKYFLPEFLHFYVKSIRSEWMKFAAGLRKDPNINGKIIDRMVLPLPPLNEQKRIVERVEQLVGLCDELEEKLRKSRKNSEILMETVVRGLLEGAIAEI